METLGCEEYVNYLDCGNVFTYAKTDKIMHLKFNREKTLFSIVPFSETF